MVLSSHLERLQLCLLISGSCSNQHAVICRCASAAAAAASAAASAAAAASASAAAAAAATASSRHTNHHASHSRTHPPLLLRLSSRQLVRLALPSVYFCNTLACTPDWRRHVLPATTLNPFKCTRHAVGRSTHHRSCSICIHPPSITTSNP